MKITIKLHETKPLRDVRSVLILAAGKKGVSLSSILNAVFEDDDTASHGYNISNFYKIDTLENPGIRLLYTVVRVAQELGVEVWLSPTIGISPIKLF